MHRRRRDAVHALQEGTETETKTLTFAAIHAKQLVTTKWDYGERETTLNATPAVMPPTPSRMSGNEEVWQGAQTAQASFRTDVWGVVCALVKIGDEDIRREGEGLPCLLGLGKNSSQVALDMCVPFKKMFVGRALVKDASRSMSGIACKGLRVNMRT